MASFYTSLLILIATSFTQVYGAKIVIFPVAFFSHVSEGQSIGNSLAEMGHDVYMIFPEDFEQMDEVNKGLFKIITHHVPEKAFNDGDLSAAVVHMIGVPMKYIKSNLPGGSENCRNILSDHHLYDKLKDINADLFLLDSLIFTHCVFALPYRLGVPYASYGTVHLPQWARNPSLPSFTPNMLGTPYTEKITFFERLDNLLVGLHQEFFPEPTYNRENWVQKYAPEMPPVSLDYLVRRSSLWLVNNDILLEYPRPMMPNEIFVGGLTTKPAKSLPKDLDNIVYSAEDGVIVMSFGSGLPDINSEKFMKVFGRLKQVVLWRHMSNYTGDTPVPKNVHMLKWLPQNDLMGHKTVKLFITHGGSNGQFEALYHGVLMLAFPAFAEQPLNAKRMAYHGFGRVLDILKFTEQELEEAVIDIITNPSYMQRIKHASAIYRSRPDTPIERVTYWVDHVLKYGDSHLKSYAIEMSWCSYWMIDIFAFLTNLIIVILCISYCILQRCCARSAKPKSD